MKVVKINAIWCSSCLVMNKVWKNILKRYDIETVELDIDVDEEVEKYHPGNILPVFIVFEGDNEVLRLTGELKEEEMIERLKGVCELHEKDN